MVDLNLPLYWARVETFYTCSSTTLKDHQELLMNTLVQPPQSYLIISCAKVLIDEHLHQNSPGSACFKKAVC
jgi:hypothetical protein